MVGTGRQPRGGRRAPLPAVGPAVGLAAGLAAAAALAGCMARTQPLKTTPAATVQQYSVAAIEVTRDRGTVPPEVEGAVETALRQATDQCADGPRPILLDARLDFYREADPTLVVLAGDRSVLAGRVALRDPATRRVLTSGYIESFVGGAGLIGVAITQLSQGSLPGTFASDVCEEIWQRTLPGSAFTPQGPPNQD